MSSSSLGLEVTQHDGILILLMIRALIRYKEDAKMLDNEVEGLCFKDLLLQKVHLSKQWWNNREVELRDPLLRVPRLCKATAFNFFQSTFNHLTTAFGMKITCENL